MELSVVLNHIYENDNVVHTKLEDQIKSSDYRVYHYLIKLSYRLYQKKDESLLTDDGEPIINKSQTELSKITGLGLTTIKRSLKRLESVELIRVIRRRGYGKICNQIILLGSFYDYISDSEYEKWVKEKQSDKTNSKRCFDMKVELDKLHKKGIMTNHEKQIVDVSNHYNMLAREMIGRGGYHSLSKKEPWNHKNWPRFDKLVKLCKENGWNPKQYLDSQFDRARKYWKNSRMKFPLPHMLCSENAIRYFKNWRQEQDDFQEDNPKYNRNKSRKTYNSVYKQIIHDVMQAAERVDHHMRMYYENRDFHHYQLVYYKMKYIVENYWLFPASYLYSFKFIRKNPDKLIHYTSDYKLGYTSKIQDDIKSQFPMLKQSKKMSETCIRTRKEVEKSSGYFVRGSFNVMDRGQSERYYRYSLHKLGISDEQIDYNIELARKKDKEIRETLKSGGHLGNIKTMDLEDDKDLYDADDEELEEINESFKDDLKVEEKRKKRMAEFKARGLTNMEITIENMIDSKRREAYCDNISFNEDKERAHLLEVFKPWIQKEKEDRD